MSKVIAAGRKTCKREGKVGGPTREGRHGWCWASLQAHAARRSHGRREGSVKRSIVRSLFASTVAVFHPVGDSGCRLRDARSRSRTRVRAPLPRPEHLSAGRDRRRSRRSVWFTEENGNRIGRITPGGADHGIPASDGRSPAGRDTVRRRRQALWFTELGPHQDRRDHDGRRHHRVPIRVEPGRACGRDHRRPGRNALWFTEFGTRRDQPDRSAWSGGADRPVLQRLRAAARVTSPSDPTSGSGSRSANGKVVGAIPTARPSDTISHSPSPER